MMQSNGHPQNSPYSDRVYVVAAALDPNYGYIWLDEDHPGSPAVKCSLKQLISGMFPACSSCCFVNILTLTATFQVITYINFSRRIARVCTMEFEL